MCEAQFKFTMESMGSSVNHVRNSKSLVHVAWDPPPEGTLKVNVDSSVNPQGNVTCGGVFKEHNGV